MSKEFIGVWIPANVWLDENLTAIDRVVCGEIFRHGDNYNLTTAELAEFCKCDEWEIATSVRNLAKYKYIEISKKGIQ